MGLIKLLKCILFGSHSMNDEGQNDIKYFNFGTKQSYFDNFFSIFGGNVIVVKMLHSIIHLQFSFSFSCILIY